jgi:hypothetical protein
MCFKVKLIFGKVDKWNVQSNSSLISIYVIHQIKLLLKVIYS